MRTFHDSAGDEFPAKLNRLHQANRPDRRRNLEFGDGDAACGLEGENGFAVENGIRLILQAFKSVMKGRRNVQRDPGSAWEGTIQDLFDPQDAGWPWIDGRRPDSVVRRY